MAGTTGPASREWLDLLVKVRLRTSATGATPHRRAQVWGPASCPNSGMWVRSGLAPGERQVRAKLGRVWARPTQTWPNRSKFGRNQRHRVCPKLVDEFDRVCPKLVNDFALKLIERMPTLAEVDPKLLDFAPILAEIGPTTAERGLCNPSSLCRAPQFVGKPNSEVPSRPGGELVPRALFDQSRRCSGCSL